MRIVPPNLDERHPILPNLTFDLCLLTFDLERSELVRPARLAPVRCEPQARNGVTDGVLRQATFRRKVARPEGN
jgi:hypothetical protein